MDDYVVGLELALGAGVLELLGRVGLGRELEFPLVVGGGALLRGGEEVVRQVRLHDDLVLVSRRGLLRAVGFVVDGQLGLGLLGLLSQLAQQGLVGVFGPVQHRDGLLQGLQLELEAFGLLREGVRQRHPQVELLFREQAELIEVVVPREFEGQGTEGLLLAEAQRQQVVEMLPRFLWSHRLSALGWRLVHGAFP